MSTPAIPPPHPSRPSTQVKPDLLSYEGACQLVRPLEAACPGLLRNGGELPRDAEGVVSLPRLRHLGSNRDGSMLAVARCCPLKEPRRDHTANVYALLGSSTPSPGVQSRVDVDESLFCGGVLVGRAGRPSELAARRALAALRRKGVWVLSLFEVLVFTFHWHVTAHRNGFEELVIGPDGWVLLVPTPHTAHPSPGGGANPNPVPSAIVGSTAAAHGQGQVGGLYGRGGSAGGQGQAVGGGAEGSTGGGGAGGHGGGGVQWSSVGKAAGFVSNQDAAEFLRPLLVAMVGSRVGKVPALPGWLGDDAILQKDVLGGLRVYAKVSSRAEPASTAEAERELPVYDSEPIT